MAEENFEIQVLKCPQIEGFPWTSVNNFTMAQENLKFIVLKCPKSEGFSWTSLNDFTMVEENFEIHSSEMPQK